MGERETLGMNDLSVHEWPRSTFRSFRPCGGLPAQRRPVHGAAGGEGHQVGLQVLLGDGSEVKRMDLKVLEVC